VAPLLAPDQLGFSLHRKRARSRARSRM